MFSLNRNIKIILLLVLICVIAISVTTVVELQPTSIHTATYEELTEITGIGDIKAERILSYLESNKEAAIDDLDDINGIGDILIDRLSKEFR